MAQPLSGPGLGLQVPQSLYPTNINPTGEIVGNTNIVSLAPGDALPIPAGRYIINCGKYCSLQYLDPVATSWQILRDNDSDDSTTQIWSDGFNVRIANLTGCVVGATVTNGGGAGYVAGATTITPSAGTSIWAAIVGGVVATSGGTSITAVGANYGIAPLVFVDVPAAPGIAATAVANISGGTVTSLTWINQGAGYTIAPNISIVPNPADPNVVSGTVSITNATAVASLTGAGSITAAILLNPGAPVASTMSLTVTGGGTTATVVPLFLQTVASASFTNVGAGYGANTYLGSAGGFNNNTGAFTNPVSDLTGFVPRPFLASLVQAGGTLTSISKIIDAGLFLANPTALPLTNGVVTTASTITFTTGSQNDTVRIQQLS